jgi:hypothetical protein
VGSAEWLRLYARQFEDQHAPQNLTIGMREAAAEIESLRFQLNGVIKMRNEVENEITRLRAALREISGDNWFFIEDAKNIARTALGGDND